MKCPKCGFDAGESGFCPNCGTDFTNISETFEPDSKGSLNEKLKWGDEKGKRHIAFPIRNVIIICVIIVAIISISLNQNTLNAPLASDSTAPLTSDFEVSSDENAGNALEPSSTASNNSSEEDANSSSLMASSQSPKDTATYKKQCKTVKYKDIARNPDNYIGKKVKFTGQVEQIEESYGENIIRLQVTKDEYGTWSNDIYVTYAPQDTGKNRVLEDDVITIYGKAQGIQGYDTVLGSQRSIPKINAQYVEISEESSSNSITSKNQI